MVLRTKNVFQILYEKKNKNYNIKHMGQELATAHGDRSPGFTGTETEGHTAESTGLTTLT